MKMPYCDHAKTRHCRVTGLIGYFAEADRMNGKELFSINVQENGRRTLQARCEMFDDALVRSVFLTNDAMQNAVEAFVHIEENSIASGSGSYHLHNGRLEAVLRGKNGRPELVSEQCSDHAFFGTHSLINDGWLAQLGGRSSAVGKSGKVRGLVTCSLAANGGGPPGVKFTDATITALGERQLTVGAGTFDCCGWQVGYGDFPPLEMWLTNDDILALMTWEHLAGRYELLSLERTGGNTCAGSEI